MDNEQLLQAISEMLDKKLDEKLVQKLQPINDRLDKIEGRLDVMEVIQKRNTRKLDDLKLDIKIAERDIKRDIHDLNDEVDTVIEILKINEILPR